MYRKTIASLIFVGASLLSLTGLQAEDGPHVEPMKEFLAAEVAPWLGDPIVVDAVKAQNAKHASLTQADIDKLDKTWRAEVDASDKPLSESILSNALSKFLAEKKDAADGAITEIFIMDNKGLNVGQSDLTSDYWQGDEAKWQKTFQVGAGAIFVDEVENDESTQTLQSQASTVIVDPASGEVIGAVTLAVDVDAL